MSAETKKQQFRDNFKEYIKQNLHSDLGQLSHKQISYALLRVYISEIYNHLSGYISDEDFDAGYVDASSDLGIDFIYRDGNKVEICQVKYAKDGATAKMEDIEHFQKVFLRLSNPLFHANSKLKELLSDIDFENDTFQLRYITLAKIGGQAKVQCDIPISAPEHLPDLNDRVSIEYYDESDLNQEFRSALTLHGGIPKRECTLISWGNSGKRSEIIEITTGGYRSFIMVMSAAQIVNLYNQFRDSLFTLNIRNYIGSTQTNKHIIETARKHPEDFFLYNNGISCLATTVEIVPPGDRVTIAGIQVINGAQTVRSLVKAYQSGHGSNSALEAIVLVRITEVPAYGAGSSFVNNVVRFNNTQNVIKVSDFRSNDPVQNDLKAKFSKIHRQGKSVEYVPKRTDRVKPNSLPIRMEDFAKAIYAFLYDPVDFANSASFLFDDREDGGYKYVFGDGKHVWTTVPEVEFKLRSAIWWLSTEFGDLLSIQRQNADSVEKMALERKWMLLYAAKGILEQSFGADGYRDHLTKFYKGDWKLGEDITGKWFQEIYDKAKFAVKFTYKQAAKRTDFVHRNWMRSRSTTQEINEFMIDNPSLKISALKSS